jgi:hypothetical protein
MHTSFLCGFLAVYDWSCICLMHLWQAVLCMVTSTVSCEQGLNQQIFIKNMKSCSLSLETLDCLVLILPINLDVAMRFSLFQMERGCLKREELKIEFFKTYDPCEFVECDMFCIPPFVFFLGYYFMIVFNVHKCEVASTLWLMLSLPILHNQIWFCVTFHPTRWSWQ